MNNETEYRIKKAQHIFYRRGQMKELRGFNTAIRLFSGEDDGFRAEHKAKQDPKPSFWQRNKRKILGGGLALAGLAAGAGLAAHTGRELQESVQSNRASGERTTAQVAAEVTALAIEKDYKTAISYLGNEIARYGKPPHSYYLTLTILNNLKGAAEILKSHIAQNAKAEDKIIFLPQAKALVAKAEKLKVPETSETYAAEAGNTFGKDYNYAKGKVSSLYNKMKKKFE